MPALQLPAFSLPPSTTAELPDRPWLQVQSARKVDAGPYLEPGRREVDREAEEVPRHLVDRRRAIRIQRSSTALEHRLVLRDPRPLHPGELARERRGVEQRRLRQDAGALIRPCHVSPSAPGVPFVGTVVVAIGARHERHASGAGSTCTGSLTNGMFCRYESSAPTLTPAISSQADAVDVDVVAVGALIRAELAELLQVGGRRGVRVDDAVRAAVAECRRWPSTPPAGTGEKARRDDQPAARCRSYCGSRSRACRRATRGSSAPRDRNRRGCRSCATAGCLVRVHRRRNAGAPGIAAASGLGPKMSESPPKLSASLTVR